MENKLYFTFNLKLNTRKLFKLNKVSSSLVMQKILNTGCDVKNQELEM